MTQIIFSILKSITISANYQTNGETYIGVTGGIPLTVTISSDDIAIPGYRLTIVDESGTADDAPNNISVVTEGGETFNGITVIDCPGSALIIVSNGTSVSSVTNIFPRLVLDAHSVGDQVTSVLLVPEIISFGSDQGGGGDPVQLVSDVITFNVGGWYEIRVIYTLGRTSGTAVEELNIQTFKNGVETLHSYDRTLVGPIAHQTISFTESLCFQAAETIHFEQAATVAAGAIDIGLIARPSPVAGWGTSFAASMKILKLG